MNENHPKQSPKTAPNRPGDAQATTAKATQKKRKASGRNRTRENKKTKRAKTKNTPNTKRNSEAWHQVADLHQSPTNAFKINKLFLFEEVQIVMIKSRVA